MSTTAPSAALWAQLHQREIAATAPDDLEDEPSRHEIGHLFDASVRSDALRARFAELIDRPGEWGWTATNRNPPIEQFAQLFAGGVYQRGRVG
jgi:hypothetical protein